MVCVPRAVLGFECECLHACGEDEASVLAALRRLLALRPALLEQSHPSPPPVLSRRAAQSMVCVLVCVCV